jgi:hypothetical protein
MTFLGGLAADPLLTLGVGVLVNLFALAVGALVTWWVARRYYRESARDLQRGVALLQKTISILARALQEKGLADAVWDEQGNLTGIEFHGTTTASVLVTDSAAGEVTPGKQ